MNSNQNPAEIGKKVKAFMDKMKAGIVNPHDYRANPVAVALANGIVINPEKEEEFRKSVEKTFIAHNIDENTDFSKLEASSAGCFWCTQGMAVAIAALMILTIAAIAAAVVVFTDGAAIPAIEAFLESQFAVKVATAIIIASAEVLAEMLCKKFGAC